MATLIYPTLANVPSALALGPTTGLTNAPLTSSFSSFTVGASVTLTLQNTYYQVNSIVLTAGTWVVLGLVPGPSATVANTFVAALSLITASGTNAAPIQSTVGAATVTGPIMTILSVIKVTTTTTIYLNVECTTAAALGNVHGGLIATQIL